MLVSVTCMYIHVQAKMTMLDHDLLLKLQLLSNKSCDQQVIMWLTDKVQRWKFLARRLELEENELHRIETDNPNNDREQCYQMFLRWKAVYPQNYTYPVLGEALRKESKELYNDYVKQVHRVEGKIILPISE